MRAAERATGERAAPEAATPTPEPAPAPAEQPEPVREPGESQGSGATSRGIPNVETSSDELPPPAGWPPRDMLTPFVLLAVSMQRAHGYLIEEYLRGLGVFGFTMSTLYRMLRQMEHDGYLASAWEPGPTGPARRVYTLTDTGRMWLDASAAWLDVYRGTIDRFFGLYTGNQAWPGGGRGEKEDKR